MVFISEYEGDTGFRSLEIIEMHIVEKKSDTSLIHKIKKYICIYICVYENIGVITLKYLIYWTIYRIQYHISFQQVLLLTLYFKFSLHFLKSLHEVRYYIQFRSEVTVIFIHAAQRLNYHKICWNISSTV